MSEQNGWHFADNSLECISFNENVWIPNKISLKCARDGPINIKVGLQCIKFRNEMSMLLKIAVKYLYYLKPISLPMFNTIINPILWLLMPLAPCVAKSSATMVLNMQDEQVIVFHTEGFQPPENCENWLGLVNSCVYYACQTHEFYQVLPYSMDLKAPGEL